MRSLKCLKKTPLTFFFLILFSSLLYSQNTASSTLNHSSGLHLSLSGFGGFKRQFDQSFFPSYGLSVQLKISEMSGIQFDWNRSAKDDSHDWTTENPNDFLNSDVISVYKSSTCMATLVVTPFDIKREIQPFFRIGVSRNAFYGHEKRSEVTTNFQGEIIDTTEWVPTPETETIHYGFVIASGLRICSPSLVDFYGEMLYNAIGGRAYNGGIFFQAGLIFKIV